MFNLSLASMVCLYIVSLVRIVGLYIVLFQFYSQVYIKSKVSIRLASIVGLYPVQVLSLSLTSIIGLYTV